MIEVVERVAGHALCVADVREQGAASVLKCSPDLPPVDEVRWSPDRRRLGVRTGDDLLWLDVAMMQPHTVIAGGVTGPTE